jgi:hypothetical protein
MYSQWPGAPTVHGMDPVRKAIFDRLSATPAVTSQLGAVTNIFHRVAPRAAVPPYVVMHRQAETDNWTFAGQPLERDMWTVKAICRGSSATQAEDIAKAITTALNDAAITVDGYALLNLRRESKIDYGEQADAETWHHAGGIFRVDIDPL